jgi:hypothetical protein
MFSLCPSTKQEVVNILVHIHEWELMNHETNSPLTANNLSPSQEIPRIAHNHNTYYIIHINWPLRGIKSQFHPVLEDPFHYITSHFGLNGYEKDFTRLKCNTKMEI